MQNKGFGFIKDPHLMFGFKNNIRVSGWENDIILKLEFIRDSLLSRGINKLIFSGDVLDKHKASDWSFIQYSKNKKILKEIFIDAGIELYSNQGNHDMFNGREDIKDTVFGQLIEEGIINYLTANPLEFSNFILYGIDYSSNKDKIISSLDKLSNLEINKKKAVVLHSNITTEIDRFTDFTYGQLSQYNIDYFYCGHYHNGYKIQTINNSTFINPWNLTRVVRDYAVKLDEHTPELIITILEPEIKIESVLIPIRPFSEAFKMEAIRLIDQQGLKFFNEINFEELMEKIKNNELSDEESIDILIQEHLKDKSKEEQYLIRSKALQYLQGE